MKKCVKSRQEIADEYGVSSKTLSRWLKKYNLEISTGLLTIHEQELIYTTLGLQKKMDKFKNGSEGL